MYKTIMQKLTNVARVATDAAAFPVIGTCLGAKVGSVATEAMPKVVRVAGAVTGAGAGAFVGAGTGVGYAASQFPKATLFAVAATTAGYCASQEKATTHKKSI